MNKLLLSFFLLFSIHCIGQKDTSKWIRAFPITDYMVDMKDSVELVQVHRPDGVTIADKQAGLLKGIYRDIYDDTIVIGAGMCNLIKGEYCYFTINYKESGKTPREGDLLFIIVDRTPVYTGNIVKLASYYIGFKNVYEKSLYDRFAVFLQWKKSDEEALMDSMLTDIHFTGDYFLKNNPAMNIKVKGGKYEGKMVLNTMIACNKDDLNDFLGYMIARPRLYEGHEWKIAEVFATWLSEGAPTVIKN